MTLADVTLRDDVIAERALLADSLEAVGPQAPTGCGQWTAFDLGAHVVAGEWAAGVPASCIRALGARGVQFHPRPQAVDKFIERTRRHGFPAVIEHLRRPGPRLLLTGPVVASTLFEVWMHHDDLARANDLLHGTPTHLGQALPALVGYHRLGLPAARLTIHATDGQHWVLGDTADPPAFIGAPTADLIRWLAGRPTQTALNIAADPAIAQQLHTFLGSI
ncbi:MULTISPECIES: maleylpyruvate isomerase family mycothiol-dependent enzyme [Mycobacterium avium complex (MAC)]|uniref:Maleylpyruvate isomerase family mycothiol-dependent enzyme n=1 Tax=Mycobacterium intracellulare subsp. chimaera TaxID=222805 RepID=A0ABT7PAM1_MYCIT|nr:MULTISPECIES: maleylpyruvate isomerase family mycothiol-dependent enzyme [Mycobacterium avium complex (MAC)]AOS94726.1 hypothetical protein AN480_26885 [Mycobacterium intracellulare subsp. chimaera]MDM3930324.1 maleylpyruvate isomerase family mycothiol-dependent enzyme [Mycobacterium intracellulare subsp. chimaera]